MSDSHIMLLADLVLVAHALFVCFVVLSLPLILLGGYFNWSWVRNRIFRYGHLLAIGFVVVQTWRGKICPLTIWESKLRIAAGEMPYERGFIADWLHSLLFYSAPQWVFGLVYTLFAALIVMAWWRVPPASKV